MNNTLPADVGVEIGNKLMMAANRMFTLTIVGENDDGYHVVDETSDLYYIPHGDLHLYLVVVE